MMWSFALLLLALRPAPDALARFVAGSPPVEENIRFVRVAPIDGNARAETHAGRACLRTDAASGNAYLYFDVRRPWLHAHGEDPYRIELTVEYLDEGTGPLAVQYDAEGNDTAANYREVSWRRGGTGEWRVRTLTLENVEFRNSQQGQADFRITGGPERDACITGLSLHVLAASVQPRARPAPPVPVMPTPAEARLPLAKARLQAASPWNEAERLAVERLRERLRAVSSRTSGEERPAATLVVGRWRSALARRFPRTARLVRRLAADPTAFRRRDGFIVCMERGGPAPLVCAVGLQSPGAVYAVGELHARALRDGARATLYLPRAPRVEAPSLDRRELYLNIGYGLRRPGITVEDWTDADWRRYIDALLLARYNAWSFYLWGDVAPLHPAARANHALNVRLHAALRRAIAYAHRRGMKVGLQFTPTMLPREVWEAHPALRAKLEYAYPGTVCPSQPETWRWMREVYDRELRWFTDCDFYSLWFYDVGGCFCETCRVPEQQLRTLMEQVKTFAPMTRRANPRAAFQVMAWAIWRYERMHGYSMRDRFVAETKRALAGRQPLGMADGIYVDPGCKPLFAEMRRAGIPAVAFLYHTNIETGQPFPLLLTRYLARWVPEAVRAGATSAFLMRIEAGSKTPDDVVAGAYLWNPAVAPDAALLVGARLLTGDTRAACLAWEALRRMDDFAWYGYAGGGADAARGRRIADLSRRAVKAAPPALRDGLEWLRASGDAYRILGTAAEARDREDDAALNALDAEFTAAMRRSPLLRGQIGDAPYWRALFRASLARSFHTGWAAYHF